MRFLTLIFFPSINSSLISSNQSSFNILEFGFLFRRYLRIVVDDIFCKKLCPVWHSREVRLCTVGPSMELIRHLQSQFPKLSAGVNNSRK
jgi:hypothetical protein